MNDTSVDSYLENGCGRCDKYQTPQCKVHLWTEPLVALREILRGTELDEEMKWGSPCYTLGGKNVLMLGSFKNYCSISFLKGVALEDPRGVLESPGPNSRYARLIKFTSVDEVHDQLGSIADLYVGGAKKSQTREDRVDRSIPKIFAGKGYNER